MINKSTHSLLLLAGLLGATAVIPAFASGSYSGRPPKPAIRKNAENRMDQTKYGLGQKIFEGRANIINLGSSSGDTEAQRERLKMAQALLPADTASSADLTSLAGKISTTELAALEYYLKQRFGMNK